MTDSTALGPPPDMKVTDPGARQLCSSPFHRWPQDVANLYTAESSDDEDQFTDAQSGPVTPRAHSPVPTTRVEKVDNEPSYGEVPGTEAYEKREGDADPDEIAVIPDRDGANTPQNERGEENDDEPPDVENAEIPVTVLEEAPGDGPSPRSEEAESKRSADAAPDIVISSSEESPEGDDDFGDDFDDFEEGGQGDDGFDDFEGDDFEQPQQPSTAPATIQPSTLPFVSPPGFLP